MIEQIPWFNGLPDEIVSLIARLLLVVLALIIILVLRRVLTWIIIRPLRRLTKRNGYEKEDALVDVVVVPIRYMIIAISILISVQILGLGSSVDVFIAHLARSLIIFALLMLIYRIIDFMAPSSNRLFAITGITIEERLLPFFRTAIKLLVIAVGVVIIVQEWGYDVSGLIAGLGLGGLAFSLAAQDTVANLFGFAAIVSDSPFNVGEYIMADGVEGIVEHVGLRSTRIRRLDQAVIYMPNNRLANANILNWSRLKKRRVDYILGVTYDATSGQIRVLLHRIREMLKEQPTVDPESIVVYFLNFGDSALEILVRSYVLISDWGEFTAEKERLNLEVLDIVNDLGMSIAFPSRSLYIENLPEIVTSIRNKPDEKKHPTPNLSPRERALMRGDMHEHLQAPLPDEEANVTGQQDEDSDK